MTDVWLPLALTLLAVAAMYLCCIRPMRRGKGVCRPAPTARTRQSADEEIRRTREELRLLREQAAARRPDPTSRPDR
ncbi:hypothetical protein [Streptomyces regalis]|uniref:Uncharacterized protein n=1 Tax=Streptomyces regalis TaxID=68262 RepID=A0A0X3VDS2_9ACTN|nr:hypothetical protein [Streptomyces regalis]KUL42557.1 hypothetical protein ADL12_09960 [Streptomyces regalis]